MGFLGTIWNAGRAIWNSGVLTASLSIIGGRGQVDTNLRVSIDRMQMLFSQYQEEDVRAEEAKKIAEAQAIAEAIKTKEALEEREREKERLLKQTREAEEDASRQKEEEESKDLQRIEEQQQQYLDKITAMLAGEDLVINPLFNTSEAIERRKRQNLELKAIKAQRYARFTASHDAVMVENEAERKAKLLELEHVKKSIEDLGGTPDPALQLMIDHFQNKVADKDKPFIDDLRIRVQKLQDTKNSITKLLESLEKGSSPTKAESDELATKWSKFQTEYTNLVESCNSQKDALVPYDVLLSFADLNKVFMIPYSRIQDAYLKGRHAYEDLTFNRLDAKEATAHIKSILSSSDAIYKEYKNRINNKNYSEARRLLLDIQSNLSLATRLVAKARVRKLSGFMPWYQDLSKQIRSFGNKIAKESHISAAVTDSHFRDSLISSARFFNLTSNTNAKADEVIDASNVQRLELIAIDKAQKEDAERQRLRDEEERRVKEEIRRIAAKVEADLKAQREAAEIERLRLQAEAKAQAQAQEEEDERLRLKSKVIEQLEEEDTNAKTKEEESDDDLDFLNLLPSVPTTKPVVKSNERESLPARPTAQSTASMGEGNFEPIPEIERTEKLDTTSLLETNYDLLTRKEQQARDRLINEREVIARKDRLARWEKVREETTAKWLASSDEEIRAKFRSIAKVYFSKTLDGEEYKALFGTDAPDELLRDKREGEGIQYVMTPAMWEKLYYLDVIYLRSSVFLDLHMTSTRQGDDPLGFKYKLDKHNKRILDPEYTQLTDLFVEDFREYLNPPVRDFLEDAKNHELMARDRERLKNLKTEAPQPDLESENQLPDDLLSRFKALQEFKYEKINKDALEKKEEEKDKEREREEREEREAKRQEEEYLERVKQREEREAKERSTDLLSTGSMGYDEYSERDRVYALSEDGQRLLKKGEKPLSGEGISYGYDCMIQLPPIDNGEKFNSLAGKKVRSFKGSVRVIDTQDVSIGVKGQTPTVIDDLKYAPKTGEFEFSIYSDTDLQSELVIKHKGEGKPFHLTSVNVHLTMED